MHPIFVSLLLGSRLSAAPLPVLNPWIGPLTDNLTIAAQATVITKPLINKLKLNEAEYVRLRVLNKRWLVGLDDIKQNTPNPLMQRVEIMGLESRFEQECQRVLTPSQVGELRLDSPHDVMPTEPADNQGGLG
jgi:predicted ribonuclease YlaK